MSVLVYTGTKAQLVKMAPVLRELDRQEVDYAWWLSGQHEETIQDLIADFQLRQPQRIMLGGLEADTQVKLLRWACRSSLSLVAALRRQSPRPTCMLVHGDTASTLQGAAIARLLSIPVLHVEAGLRSSRLMDPFPEEIIRRAVSRLSCVHYCQDRWSLRNLDGQSGARVNLGANTLLDTLRLSLRYEDHAQFDEDPPYCIASIHRTENLKGARFRFIVEELVTIARKLEVRFILHPVTRATLRRRPELERRLRAAPGVKLIERMNHARFVAQLYGARFVVTDGGSNQEECAALGIPCLLLRMTTERQDGLSTSVVLSRLNRDTIQGFVAKHIAAGSARRSLPEHQPSRHLVQDLIERGLATARPIR
ncbi:MAG: UDP-N-acetylglucosamine 2-epimerase [Xanthomonadales bacterium]|nr:UDP-N-acetylglucosamine 2-epimerase [Xanthomonadales bacterium]